MVQCLIHQIMAACRSSQKKNFLRWTQRQPLKYIAYINRYGTMNPVKILNIGQKVVLGPDKHLKIKRGCLDGKMFKTERKFKRQNVKNF